MPTSSSALPEERSFNNPNPALEIERRSLAPVTVFLGGGGATIGCWIDWRALEGVLRLGLGNEGATICLRGVVAVRELDGMANGGGGASRMDLGFTGLSSRRNSLRDASV